MRIRGASMVPPRRASIPEQAGWAGPCQWHWSPPGRRRHVCHTSSWLPTQCGQKKSFVDVNQYIIYVARGNVFLTLMHKMRRTNGVSLEKQVLFRCTNKVVIYKSLPGRGEGESARHSRGAMLSKCLSFVSKIRSALSKISMFVP